MVYAPPAGEVLHRLDVDGQNGWIFLDVQPSGSYRQVRRIDLNAANPRLSVFTVNGPPFDVAADV